MNLRAALQKLFARRLFSRPAEPGGCRDIIQWWEWRRIPYNLAVGAAGIVTLSVVIGVAAIASEKFDEPLGLPDPPILAVVAVIACGLGANLCFTGGWIVEILARWLWPERVGAFAPMAFAPWPRSFGAAHARAGLPVHGCVTSATCLRLSIPDRTSQTGSSASC